MKKVAINVCFGGFAHVWRTAAEGERSSAGDIDHTFYGLRKFVGLACQGNPSILAALFAPEVKLHHITDLGRELQALSPSIVSKRAIPRFRGYMRSQALRLTGERGMGRGARTGARPELVEMYGFDTKFAMHMVRLGMQGIELAKIGRLRLPMKGIDKDIAKTVRHGRWTVDESLEYAFTLDAQLAQLEIDSELPDIPDYEAVNDWLHHAYQTAWASHLTRRQETGETSERIHGHLGGAWRLHFWPSRTIPGVPYSRDSCQLTSAPSDASSATS